MQCSVAWQKSSGHNVYETAQAALCTPALLGGSSLVCAADLFILKHPTDKQLQPVLAL